MMHQQRTTQYEQQVFAPSTSAVEAGGAWLLCLGRLRGTGRFDLEQVPSQPSLHVVQSGAGWLTSGRGRAEPLGPGDVFAILPGERARYREDPHRPWRYTWLGFTGLSACALLSGAGIAGQVRILRRAATPQLWRLCDEAEATYAAASCSPFAPAVLALRICEALVPSGTTAAHADPVASLRMIIDSGYHGDLTVGGAAERLGVDRSTLFRRFRSSYGCGPRTYMQRVRLDRARELLRRGGDTVTAVAAACGYDDHRAFARAYRARHGVNPTSDLSRG
jgi:AraC-like DNA-binding protein